MLEETTPITVEMFHRRITMSSQKNCTIDVQPRFNFREDENIISPLCLGKILFHVLGSQNSRKKIIQPIFFLFYIIYIVVDLTSPRKLHICRTDLI